MLTTAHSALSEASFVLLRSTVPVTACRPLNCNDKQRQELEPSPGGPTLPRLWWALRLQGSPCRGEMPPHAGSLFCQVGSLFL